jgi:hypothetical protein
MSKTNVDSIVNGFSIKEMNDGFIVLHKHGNPIMVTCHDTFFEVKVSIR